MTGHDLYGRTLGEFVLRDWIGGGGFGAVYRAEQPLLERDVVIKVLHERRCDRISEQRFLREAQLASRLDHPYAAHVYASGVDDEDGLRWIAMELVQGVTLSQWLATYGAMPLEQFVPFFECIAQVVQAAHDRNIVHRDLKPSNIMVIERVGCLFPKLLDFGIAKMNPELAPDLLEDWPDFACAEPVCAPSADDGEAARIHAQRTRSDRLTPSGACLGSSPYMSPEQWSNAEAVGLGADIYSLGVIAYQALTGRLPFTASSPDEYCLKHRAALPPELRVAPRPELDRVIQRALAKHPRDRYRHVLEMAAALRVALRATKREQLRSSAQQWDDEDRAPGLLWGHDMLVELERQVSPEDLTELECSFVVDSQRHVRRIRWIRRSLVALAAAGILAIALMRARLAEEQTRLAQEQTRSAQKVTEATITQAELEQGRAALLHGETEEAQIHLSEAYRRGDHSSATAFMLARALQPRLAEQARFSSSSGRMWSATFSPDGRKIVTTDESNAQIWDAASHRLLFTLAHGHEVYQALYIDDATLITAAQDAVRIWDTMTGTLIRKLTQDRLDGKSADYFSIAISQGGKLVAAIDAMGAEVHVWNATTGAALVELPTDGAEFPALAFSYDGRWLAATGGSEVRVYDTGMWSASRTLPGHGIQTLSWDPTGPRLVTGSTSGDAAIWEVPSGARVRSLREGGEPVDWVASAPNGELIVTASRDGKEQVWDARSGALRSQGNYLRGRIQSIEFDAASRLVVAAGASGSVAVSDITPGMPAAILDGPRGPVLVVHFDPSSPRVIGASRDGTARIWDARPPYLRWASPPISDDCGFALSVEPDRRFVAIGCRDHATRLWDSARDRLLAELPSLTSGTSDFELTFPAVSAAGDRAAIARGMAVEVYELPGGRLLRRIVHGAAVSAVAFANVGHDLVTGAVDGSIFVTHDGRDPIALPAAAGGIDAAAFLPGGGIVVADARQHLRVFARNSSSILADLETPTRIRVLRPSPDGSRLVTVSPNSAAAAPAVLWDLTRYQAISKLAHAGHVFSARFVDGRIITAGGDGTARIWDERTGQLRQTYRGRSIFFADATLSPDGAMVIAGDADGLLRFWDAATARPLWTLRAHRSYLVGIHIEGDSIVTRGFAGDLARWDLPPSAAIIEACGPASEVATTEGQPCATVPR